MTGKFRVGNVSGSSVTLSGSSGTVSGSMSLRVTDPKMLEKFKQGEEITVTFGNDENDSKTGTDVGQQRR